MSALSRIPQLPCLQRGALPLLACFVMSCGSPTQAPLQPTKTPAHLPTFLDDPAEPVNRGIWAANRLALEAVVNPVSRTYRMLIPQRVRTSIGHAGTNVLYPGRLLNETLQGRWQDAGDDSLRFLTNTTVGVAGLFDVATHWNMPEPRADFAQTFQKWGWKPQTYVMLPLLGPSDQSSAIARVFQEVSDPINYIPDLRAANLTFSGHRLSERNDDTMRLIRSEADPYSFTHLAWSYLSRRDAPDWTTRAAPDMPTLETLGAATIRLDDRDFLHKLRVAKVRIPATNKLLPYNVRLQPHPAPLAYILPGLGSHRLSNTALAIAEHLHTCGFSIVVLSSAFHPEFMECASTSPLPGRIQQDSRDVWNAMAEIDARLSKRHPGRITRRAMVGASMGGYIALTLAASPPDNSALHIDRFLAINPPVDLRHGAGVIDAFRDAPCAWPESMRQDRIDNAVHKVGGMSSGTVMKLNGPPFDGIESRYLIGLNFRFTLRDVLHSVEKRHHLGLVSTPFTYWNRQAAYREMLSVSFDEYAHEIMMPYYLARGVPLSEFAYNRSLTTRTQPLRSARHAMVLTNQNDFLLRAQDHAWLKSTFGPSRLQVLPSGGHLGNLGSRAVRGQINDFMKDLH
jgi:ABC-type transporter lipoprotein component MlaA/pimeloyl-ACP methyl ester carboxylesterase